MTKFGITSFKDMVQEERLGILLAFLLLISPFLPWFVAQGWIEHQIPGIASGIGTIVVVLSLQLMIMIMVRRPLFEGIENLTLALLMDGAVFVMCLYAFSTAFFSMDFGFDSVYGTPGAGLYLALISSFLLLVTLLKARGVLGDKVFEVKVVTKVTSQVEGTEAEKDVPRKEPVVRAAGPRPGPGTGTGTGTRPKEVPVRPKEGTPLRAAPSPTVDGPGVQRMRGWLSRVNKDKKVFEKCPGCDSYNFMVVSKKGDSVFFKCTSCEAEYKLVL